MDNSATSGDSNQTIDQLLARINGLTTGGSTAPSPASNVGGSTTTQTPARPAVKSDLAKHSEAQAVGDVNVFFPEEPNSLAEAKINESVIEELVAKFLLAVGEATIRRISDQIGMPFHIVDKVVVRMKHEQLLGYIDSAAMNDYTCRLTEVGRTRAKRYSDLCSYFGAAPVAFSDYVDSVNAQTINDQNPSQEDLERAFSDLLIDPNMMIKLGPAVNSGRGMFLYGYPGNGKTSIAERITAAFGPYVWVPKAISMDRDIVRVFDPMSHIECPLEDNEGLISNSNYDRRWVRIKRPTIVVGGELTMEH
ncbi:MAG: AAA family ATPase, partial [Planctomycetota bacterium]